MIDWDTLALAKIHATFGEAATYLPGAGPSVPCQIVFNAHYTDSKFTDETEVVGTKTVLNVRQSVLPQLPTQNELFRVRGVLYAITNVQPDGHGDVRIQLRLASNVEAARAPFPPS